MASLPSNKALNEQIFNYATLGEDIMTSSLFKYLEVQTAQLKIEPKSEDETSIFISLSKKTSILCRF